MQTNQDPISVLKFFQCTEHDKLNCICLCLIGAKADIYGKSLGFEFVSFYRLLNVLRFFKHAIISPAANASRVFDSVGRPYKLRHGGHVIHLYLAQLVELLA